MRSLRFFFPLLCLVLAALTGCVDSQFSGIQSAKMTPAQYASEGQGNYWIGRRYYKSDYKFWGFVRKPGQPWSSAKLVMLNEQAKLAPDRAAGTFGSDNGYEYKLYGDFSGETVYEPASNGMYPEFVLKGYELRSMTPPRIFSEPGALDPHRRIIAKPH